MKAIVAVDNCWGIGRNNELIISNPDDMKHFVAHTTGGTVVMGRKTFQSIGSKPLKNRVNIVVSGSPLCAQAGLLQVTSIEELMVLLKSFDPETTWLIGGARLYHELLPVCTEALVTWHDIEADADCFFDNLDEDRQWICTSRDAGHQTSEGIAYEFRTYTHTL